MGRTADNGRRLQFETLERRELLSATGLVDELAEAPPVAAASNNVEAVGADILSVPDWVHSLTYHYFYQLAPDQVQYLTTAQVASIPERYYIEIMSPAARAALSAPQVQVLRVAALRLDLLTSPQISWLSAGQIQTLKVYDFKYLWPVQIPYLAPAQIAEIPDPGPFAELSAAQRGMLTQPQIQALRVGNVWIDKLTTQQVEWLLPSQIQTLRVTDFKYLTPSRVPYLSPAQMAAIPDPGPFSEWSNAARAALTPVQVRALNVGNVWIDKLTTQQIEWLLPAQVQTLRVPDFQYLTPSRVPYLSPAQIAAIPDPGPFSEWTSAARAALTPVQVRALNVANVWIDQLLPVQVGWLSASQIQSLRLGDLKRLWPAQIPYISNAQISAIPDPGLFGEWSDQQMAALTQAQIQSIRVGTVRIYRFTPQQLDWLVPWQVQSLRASDFQYLPSNRVSLLTPAQIASLIDRGPIGNWTSEHFANLTRPQVQALNVAGLGLNILTPLQISWLTTAQIRAVTSYDLPYLSTSQIPLLTLSQMNQIYTVNILMLFSDEQVAALTMTQVLGIPNAVWQTFSVRTSTIAPTSYVPAVDETGGHHGSAAALQEIADVMALVPTAAVTQWTIGSGNWGDYRIWSNGQVPPAGARVLVSSGTVVRYESWQTSKLDTLRIDGTLTFASNVNTQLMVDTIVVTSTGVLEIGTAAAPIADNVSARIVIPAIGVIDTVRDPKLLSRGLLSMGEVRMYGKTVTPYAALQTAPVRGATTLVLNSVPTNWKVGDQLVITGVNSYVPDGQKDERRILAINGNRVTIDPLTYDHIPPSGFGFSVYVSNLSRNINFVTTDDAPSIQRPHLMFLHNPDVHIENINVTGYGRTDKSQDINSSVVVNGVLQPGTGTNPRARYPIHFHHDGVDPQFDPAYISGSVVADSPGWGFVNHSSNVVMANNVAFDVGGASFVGEDGNEIGVMDGNLSISPSAGGDLITAREANNDWGFSGHGFWFQGPGIAVTNNIATGNPSSAYFYFTASSKAMFDTVNVNDPAMFPGRDAVPVNMVPIKEFSGNVAYASKTGLEVWTHQFNQPVGESIIDNFTAWNNRFTGMDVHYSGQLTVQNSTFVGDMNNFIGLGIAMNRLTEDMKLVNNRIEGFKIGIQAPSKGVNLISGGVITAYQAIYVDGAMGTRRSLTITNPPYVRTLSAAELKGNVQYFIYMDGTIVLPEHRSLAAELDADDIRIVYNNGLVATLYFLEQQGSFVPFPSSLAEDEVPANYRNKTNQQLHDLYGVSLSGGLPPAGAVAVGNIRGLAVFGQAANTD